MSNQLAVSDVPTAAWTSQQPRSPRMFDQENGFSQNFQPFMQQNKTVNPCTISDDVREEMMRLRRRENAFKTALCKTFQLTKACSYGEQCKFAHSVEELQLKHQNLGINNPKYKTVLCDNFSTTGHCKYGTKCQFIHRTVEPASLKIQNPLVPRFPSWFAPPSSLAREFLCLNHFEASTSSSTTQKLTSSNLSTSTFRYY
ncbi:C3H1-type domain-containing protein [Caenorhabditis elegans]|uniref:C3H1-type domain-containing protein n=1 Tax=Caenorhabditis elegans TaxID=6239 RepID=O18251_CAEEL|nr:C3H1-type domain-containing protein [Caenorhabditis elegans]CAB16528.1 C3H1-type domain-containing protein [Caenorhabditis elegans]|eukprot:NP_502805.1 CCCH-type zinc finger putative transcription factor [Caenorhabditis elegans]